MKNKSPFNTSKIFIVALFIVFLSACGGPKSDTRKMLNKMEAYTEIAHEASKDGVLTDEEAEKLNKISNELAEIEKKRENKIKESQSYAERANQIMRKDESEKILQEFMKAIYLLYECEGAEKLN